jgi:D-amino-acid dehydrogenase
VSGAPRRVVVVGGGIAGLCCAYSLRRRDVDVTVVEADEVGSRRASSYGNGGWICPAQAGPLPEPGLTVYGMRALLNADSALYFRPGYVPKLLPWLARFWTYCNQRDFDAGTAALAGLGKRVFDLVDGFVADGVSFELYKLGFVCATADEATARRALRSLQGMRAHGYELPDDIIVGDELHRLEPALSAKVTAGFHIEEQWHVRAHTLVTGLGEVLRRCGVDVRERSAVTGFDTADGRVRALRTAGGDVEGDAFVLAAGSWTGLLARKLGVRFPLEPGKGYTFMVRPKQMPRRGILFADIHAGATPLGERVRIGGTMEFSGFGLDIDRRRIETVHRLAQGYLELADPSYEDAWAGLRPLTPDGLPVIDLAGPYHNVAIATGYSMLGMTVGAPAGEAVADLLLTGERPALLEPFRLDRFRPLLRRGRRVSETAAARPA